MIPFALLPSAPLLLLAQATQPAGGGGELTWLTTLSQAATVVIALCLLVVAGVMIPAAWNFRKLAVRLGQIADRLRDDAQPVIRHAEAIGENVGYLSAAVREDVQGLHDTVARTSRRLDRLSAEAEARVQAFNALLKVVQEEAEEIFIGTASTVRGVRAGAEALSEPGVPGRGHRRHKTPLPEESHHGS